jgi:SAM-dependent methyltransferase
MWLTPMSRLTKFLDRAWYPSYCGNWDDERLRTKVLELLKPDMVILDIGAGAGHVKQMNFRGYVRRVVGIDPDPRIHKNPFLDEAHEGVADHLPFPDNTFDVVISDNVLEHLDDPQRVLREVARVLKPNGKFVAKTPNAFHYMTVIARFTPTAFHRVINRLRGRPDSHTFPTRYRLNTSAAIQRTTNRSGLEIVSIDYLEGRPEYLRFNALTYLLGWLYERIVNSTDLLARLRIVLLLELRKPSGGQQRCT